jgi:hypothetical protein
MVAEVAHTTGHQDVAFRGNGGSENGVVFLQEREVIGDTARRGPPVARCLGAKSLSEAR